MISCPLCQTQNPPHHRFCLQCGGPLPETHAQHNPHATPAPSQTPRQLNGSQRPLWKMHSFGLLFGGIWFIVGAPMAILGPILLLTSGLMPGLIFALVGAVFGGIGGLVLLFALRNIQSKIWLLRYGAQARGRFTEARVNYSQRLNGRPATAISWAFEDALGKTWQGELSTFDPPSDWQVLANQPATILYDPAHPDISVPLSLVPISLSSPPLSEDRRRALATADYLTPQPVTAPQDLPLTAWLPTPRNALLGLGGQHNAQAGHLRLTPDAIEQLGPDGATLARISWRDRFSVHWSVLPLPDGAAELGLSITQGSAHGAQRVRVRALANQDTLSAHLPTQELSAPWLDKHALDALRPHLDFYLQAHGERLDAPSVRPQAATVSAR